MYSWTALVVLVVISSVQSHRIIGSTVALSTDDLIGHMGEYAATDVAITQHRKKAVVDSIMGIPNIRELCIQDGYAGTAAFDRNQRHYSAYDQRMSRTKPAYYHSQIAKARLSRAARKYKKQGIFYLAAFQGLQHRLGLSREQLRWLATVKRLIRMDDEDKRVASILAAVTEQCPPEFDNSRAKANCDPYSRYRSHDGTCNNLEHAQFGAAFRNLERFLPPAYDDGIGSPVTKSKIDGSTLPNPRKISLILNQRSDDDVSKRDVDSTFSHMVMQWGQFLDHDLTHSPMTESNDENPPVCCVEDSSQGEHLSVNQKRLLNEEEFFTRPECFSFSVNGTTDPVFHGRTCHPLIRSMASPDTSCRMGVREQMNAVTSYIDGSQLYGSDKAHSTLLRTNSYAREDRGDMKSTAHHGFRSKFLPQASSAEAGDCVLGNENDLKSCFLAGDSRVNEQPGLASMHTIWMREHNRVAQFLRWVMWFSSDRIIYEEARRIVVAEMQMITYNEFLPILLDSKLRESLDLNVKRSGHHRGYDRRVNAAIRNEFSAAAFRVGHSLIRSTMSQVHSGRKYGVMQLSDHFMRPQVLTEPSTRGMGSIAGGLVQDPLQGLDRKASPEIADKLFAHEGTALDLMAMNEARGRDHGLPSYVDYRKFCGLKVPRNFYDMNDHDFNSIQALRKLYKNVEDIDLYAGGISEKALGDGLAGPTFQCIIGLQFALLKRGDRFYFETDHRYAGFRAQQLQEIRKASLARVLCDNLENTWSMQPKAFELPTVRGNHRVNCHSLPRPSLWVLGRTTYY